MRQTLIAIVFIALALVVASCANFNSAYAQSCPLGQVAVKDKSGTFRGKCQSIDLYGIILGK